MDRLFTVRQLQERLQVDRVTIYRMLQNGRLTGVKVGGQWRFREEDLQQVITSKSMTDQALSAWESSLPLPCLHAMGELYREAAELAAVVVDPQG